MQAHARLSQQAGGGHRRRLTKSIFAARKSRSLFHAAFLSSAQSASMPFGADPRSHAGLSRRSEIWNFSSLRRPGRAAPPQSAADAHAFGTCGREERAGIIVRNRIAAFREGSAVPWRLQRKAVAALNHRGRFDAFREGSVVSFCVCEGRGSCRHESSRHIRRVSRRKRRFFLRLRRKAVVALNHRGRFDAFREGSVVSFCACGKGLLPP